MKRFALSATAVLLMTGAAFAASDTGKITAVNPKGDAITLADGKIFTLGEGTEAESLMVGQKVIVTYSLVAGQQIARAIAESW